MREQYFKDKWQQDAREMYAGLMDSGTFKDTINKIGAVRAFPFISDLIRVFEERGEYEKCKQLASIKIGMENGLEMV